jgi:Flp pilus assembly protein CpaB
MRRGRIFFYLAFILLLGLLAVVVVWQRFLRPGVTGGEQTAAPTAEPTINVVVISQAIARGSVINGDAVSLLPYPRSFFYAGMYSDIGQVVGKMAKYDLQPNTPVTAGMLASSAEELSGTGSNIALSIPRGMVAISLPINRISSVSYPPQAGDHVNVIVTLRMIDLDTEFQTMLPNKIDAIITPNILTTEAGTNLIYGEYNDNPYFGKGETVAGLGWSTYSVPSEGTRTNENKPNQRPRLVSQNLLQDAIVLNVGNYASNLLGKDSQQSTTSEETSAGGEAAPATNTQSPDYISLIVTPQDAISLNYLIYSGAQITLVLRSANDDSRVQTEAATLQFLLDQYDIPVPVKLPYGVDPRADDVSVAPIPTVVVVPTAQP